MNLKDEAWISPNRSDTSLCDAPEKLSATRFAIWIALGSVLIWLTAAVFYLSHNRDSFEAKQWRFFLISIYVLLGILYFSAVLLVGGKRFSIVQLLLLVVVAILMRGWIWFCADVSREDYHRYLWDGAVTAHGENPYRYSPQQAAEPSLENSEIRYLARSNKEVLDQINHPHLRTIYPPLAQGLFAMGHFITPFDVVGWKLVLLLYDFMTAAVIFGMLRSKRFPSGWLCVYLWNPLLIVESYYFCHLDITLCLPLILFVWFLSTQRVLLSGLCLVAAIGLKVWPILLAPFWIARFWQKRANFFAAMSVSIAVLILMAVPYAFSLGSQDSSGPIAYAKTWCANALGYLPFQYAGYTIDRLLNTDSRFFVRAAVILLLLAAAIWQGKKSKSFGLEKLSLSVGLFILLMLLLSPTVYAWYFIPLIGVLAFSRRKALSVFTALLPLTLWPLGDGGRIIVVAAVHLPLWVLLIINYNQLFKTPAADEDISNV